MGREVKMDRANGRKNVFSYLGSLLHSIFHKNDSDASMAALGTCDAFSLEPRIMLDAAMFATGGEAMEDASQEAEDILTEEANQEQPEDEGAATDDGANILAEAMLPGQGKSRSISNNVDFADDAGEDEGVPDITINENELPKHVVFIDSDIQDFRILQNALPGDTEVHILNSSSDGLHQIADLLSNTENVDALHIISHGDVGMLQLGSEMTNLIDLSETQRRYLQAIGNALSGNADIMIYGCNFGAGEQGAIATQVLANLTDADVAASEDVTGNVEQGGDWDLETIQGEIEHNLAFSAEGVGEFEGVLQIITLKQGDSTSIDASALQPGTIYQFNPGENFSGSLSRSNLVGPMPADDIFLFNESITISYQSNSEQVLGEGPEDSFSFVELFPAPNSEPQVVSFDVELTAGDAPVIDLDPDSTDPFVNTFTEGAGPAKIGKINASLVDVDSANLESQVPRAAIDASESFL